MLLAKKDLIMQKNLSKCVYKLLLGRGMLWGLFSDNILFFSIMHNFFVGFFMIIFNRPTGLANKK